MLEIKLLKCKCSICGHLKMTTQYHGFLNAECKCGQQRGGERWSLRRHLPFVLPLQPFSMNEHHVTCGNNTVYQRSRTQDRQHPSFQGSNAVYIFMNSQQKYYSGGPKYNPFFKKVRFFACKYFWTQT